VVSASSVDDLANHHLSNRDGNPENLSSVWFFPNRHRQRHVDSSHCQQVHPRRVLRNGGVIKMSEAERFVALHWNADEARGTKGDLASRRVDDQAETRAAIRRLTNRSRACSGRRRFLAAMFPAEYVHGRFTEHR